jgi:hypothetical protein
MATSNLRWNSNRYFQDLDIRFRLCAFFFHDLQRSGDGFAEVGEEILDGFTLGVASRQSRDLAPEPARCFLVNDDGETAHSSKIALHSDKPLTSWGRLETCAPVGNRRRSVLGRAQGAPPIGRGLPSCPTNEGARHQNAAFLGGPIFGLVLTA